MRYVLKEKVFAFGQDFVIKDEHDRDAYIVDGKVFTLGKKLEFKDLFGRPVARIEQKLFSWGPTYEIHRNGSLAAVVKKSMFTFFRCKFTVDVPGPDDLEAEGSFFEHEYIFTRTNRSVAAVSKKWFSWGDTYGVDVAKGQDDILILASAVVIDLVCHSHD